MWRAVKACKGVALAAFLLPWVTVSCSGREVARIDGVELVTGRFSVVNPLTGSPELHQGQGSVMLLAAAALIALGLVLSFRPIRRAARAVIGTSLAAMALIWLATRGFTDEALGREAAERGAGRIGAAAASMIRVDWTWGYWLANAALLAAILMCGLALTGRTVRLARHRDAPA